MLRPKLGAIPLCLAAAAAGAFASGPLAGVRALDAKAQAHFDMKEYQEAHDLWRQAAALQPESLSTHIKMGTALTHLKRYREAESCFRQCLTIEPGDAMAHYHLSALFMHEQRYAPARKHLNLALSRTPWYPNAHYLLGYMLEKEGRYGEAAKEYVNELQVNPASQNAWYHLLSLQKQGKVGRNWDQKVEWTAQKIVALSLAMAVGLAIFIFAHVKTHGPSRAHAEPAPVSYE